jgi:hypothetical protein
MRGPVADAAGPGAVRHQVRPAVVPAVGHEALTDHIVHQGWDVQRLVHVHVLGGRLQEVHDHQIGPRLEHPEKAEGIVDVLDDVEAVDEVVATRYVGFDVVDPGLETPAAQPPAQVVDTRVGEVGVVDLQAGLGQP